MRKPPTPLRRACRRRRWRDTGSLKGFNRGGGRRGRSRAAGPCAEPLAPSWLRRPCGARACNGVSFWEPATLLWGVAVTSNAGEKGDECDYQSRKQFAEEVYHGIADKLEHL